MRTLLGLSVRSQWKRSWPSLLLIAVLVALTVGISLTAFAAARRTEGVPERFGTAAETGSGSVFVGSGNPAHQRVVRTLPAVETGSSMAIMGALPVSDDVAYVPIVAPTDGRFGVSYERGMLVEGRRADPNAPHEVALPESAAHMLGVGVGDQVVYAGYTPAEYERCILVEDEPPADCEEIYRDPAGPDIAVDVVGLVRGPRDVSGDASDFAFIVATPAFYEKYHGVLAEQDSLVGVRLRAGVSAAEFAEQARARVPDADLTFELTQGEALADAADVIATSLWVLGAIVALTAGLAAGLALMRQMQSERQSAETLRALGAERRLCTTMLFAPVALPIVTGAVLGLFGAFIASRWFPRGVPRRAEPDLGMKFDPLILVGGTLLITIALLAVAIGAAWWRATSTGHRTLAPRSRARDVAYRFGPPAVGVGVALAVDPGRDRRALPVRAAMIACVAGVAGVVCALAYGSGLRMLEDSPSAWGAPYDAVGFTDAETLLADDDVAAVAAVQFRLPIEINGRPAPGFAFESLRGEIEPTIVRGRAPESSEEIALGADTLKTSGASLGDVVRVGGANGEFEMRVVGVTAVPIVDDGNEMADGAVVAPEAVELLGERGETFNNLAVRVADGRDVDDVVARLTAGAGDFEDIQRPSPPDEVSNLTQIDAYPSVLALLLALTGFVGLAHVLSLVARRRADDFAVMRALGFRPQEVRVAVTSQAVTFAALGLAVGVPLGLVLGRWAWRTTAESVGVQVVQDLPAGVMLAIPIVLLSALLLSWIPGARAAHAKPAQLLRSE